MPKERRIRMWMGCGLGLLLAAPGCRTPKEVPPAPPYASSAAAGAPGAGAGAGVGFAQDPRPGMTQAYMGPGSNTPGGMVSQNNGQMVDPGLNPAGATMGGGGGGAYPPQQPGSRWDAQPGAGGVPAGGAPDAGAGAGAGMTPGPGYNYGAGGAAGGMGAGSPVTPSAGMPGQQAQDPGPALQESYQSTGAR